MGGIAQWLTFLLPDPAAPGSNPGSAEIFSLYCLVCGQYGDRTHPVLKQRISQMHLAVKARAKYCKKVLRCKGLFPQRVVALLVPDIACYVFIS